MFERFTDRSRKTMALANQIAQKLNHQFIEPPHILLGLIEEGGNVAATTLRTMEVDLKELRREIEKNLPPGREMITPGKLPQTQPAKQVIMFAIEEARSVGHNCIGTEHMLLGLLRVNDKVVANALSKFGVTFEYARAEMLELLGQGDGIVNEVVAKGNSQHVPWQFQRFTDRARKVMAMANQTAQKWNHEFIDTEHILIAMIEENRGTGVHALKALDVDLQKMRSEVTQRVEQRAETITAGKVSQTQGAKKVIENAIDESQNLGHQYVGTEHMLLGLLREEDGIAGQVLRNFGLTIEDARTAVLKVLGEGISQGEQPDPNDATPSPSQPTPQKHVTLLQRIYLSLKRMIGR